MLIDWLIETQYILKLNDETIFITVNILDWFLSKQSVSRENFNLVGLTSMLIASKYHDIHPPFI